MQTLAPRAVMQGFKMSKKFDSRLLIPVSESGKRKFLPKKCGCSVMFQRDRFDTHFRMVAIAMVTLFGLSIFLFACNIVLWRHLDGLQHEMNTLKATLTEISSSNNDVNQTPLQRSRWAAVRKRRERQKLQEKRQMDPQREGEMVMLRSKRSASEERNFAETDLHPEKNFLSRLKRASRRKTGPENVKQKKTRKARRRKDRKGKQILQKATAMHAQISGTAPYTGMNSEHGILRPWKVAFNQGFDVSELNGTSYYPGVKVRIPGVYYVYSQVTFRMTRGVEVHEKIKTGLIGALEFASCVNSMPQNHSGSDYITCSSSGITYLPKNHKFLVEIFPHSIQVFNSPSHTYFGAFLVGGGNVQ